jgi:Tol biopolymer transport system component
MERLRFTGDPVELAEHVQSDAQFNNAAFSVSGDVLTYQTGAVVAGTWLVVFDREGKETVVSKEPNLIQALALSPSGNQITASLGISSGQLSDIWMYNLQKDSKTKLTFDQHSFNPVWSPDGTRIAFERMQTNGSELVVKSASGGGSEETLYKESKRSAPVAWSSDGHYLLYRVGNSGLAEIKALSIVGERKSVSLLTTKVGWAGVALSFDGKWLTYASDESGTVELYVVPFHSGPDGASTGGGKWQVTTGGGAFPAWRRDGKELFFVATAGTMLSSIRVNAVGDRFEFDPPQYLFALAAHPVSAFYTPAANGAKIYMATYGPGSSAPITVTLNWKTLLKK